MSRGDGRRCGCSMRRGGCPAGGAGGAGVVGGGQSPPITARRCRSSSSRTGCRRVKYAPLRPTRRPNLRICSAHLGAAAVVGLFNGRPENPPIGIEFELVLAPPWAGHGLTLAELSRFGVRTHRRTLAESITKSTCRRTGAAPPAAARSQA